MTVVTRTTEENLMGTNDNSTADRLAGKAKEGLGKLTDNQEMETEGKTQQVKAQGEEAVEDAKGTVSGAVKGLSGDGEK